MTDITRVFDSFKKVRPLIIGDVMTDAYIFGKVDRISPEAPVPVVAVEKRENRLGGAANVALNLMACGANPVLCSVIGKDDKSKDFLALLDDRRMPKHGIIKSEKRKTTVKYRIIGNNVQLLRVDEETTAPLDPENTSLLLEIIREGLHKKEYDIIIFQDYDKGTITPNLIEQVIALAKEHKVPIIVDPKKKNFLNYKNVDLFKPNLKELKEGLKTEADFSDLRKIKQAMQELQKQMQAKILMTTLSEKGMMISYKEKDGSLVAEQIPAHIRNVSDVSGAGDTVISITALCMALGLHPLLTAKLANLAGGIVCEYVGVVPIDLNRLEKEAKKIEKYLWNTSL